MKRFWCFCIGMFVFFASFGKVLAHSVGQPPFLKVNGIYAGLYPVPNGNIGTEMIPQDLDEQVHVVGDVLKFEIDFDALGTPKSMYKESDIKWDFGDGSPEELGFARSHKYTKSGSFVVLIKYKFANTIFESVMVNIVPNGDYVLPKANILVNGVKYFSASGKPVDLDLNKPIQFEAQVENGQAVTYLWDFADTTSIENGKKVTHKYPADKFIGGLTYVTATLRVRDANGFILDAYVPIRNIDVEDQRSKDLRSKDGRYNKLWSILVGVGIAGVVIYLGWRRRK